MTVPVIVQGQRIGQRAGMILLRASPLNGIAAARDPEIVSAAGQLFDRGRLSFYEAKLRAKAETIVKLAN